MREAIPKGEAAIKSWLWNPPLFSGVWNGGSHFTGEAFLVLSIPQKPLHWSTFS
jgi:hypothetical protein